MLSKNGRFKGRLYRAPNPIYARESLSGRGAALYGGRFNTKGVEALYTALDPVTALREAHQVGDLQPTTLVSYKADLGPVFDTRDAAGFVAFGLVATDLADQSWRAAMLDGRPVRTQDFAKELITRGFAGCLVRSFVLGATDTNLNMVLWRWNTPENMLDVIDDEARLQR